MDHDNPATCSSLHLRTEPSFTPSMFSLSPPVFYFRRPAVDSSGENTSALNGGARLVVLRLFRACVAFLFVFLESTGRLDFGGGVHSVGAWQTVKGQLGVLFCSGGCW